MPEIPCGKYKPGGPGCRLPENHEGRCNPRPDLERRPMPEFDRNTGTDRINRQADCLCPRERRDASGRVTRKPFGGMGDHLRTCPMRMSYLGEAWEASDLWALAAEVAALRAERDRERNLRHDIHAERCALLAEVERITAERDAMRRDMRLIRHSMDMYLLPGNDRMREVQGTRAITERWVATSEQEASDALLVGQDERVDRMMEAD